MSRVRIPLVVSLAAALLAGAGCGGSSSSSASSGSTAPVSAPSSAQSPSTPTATGSGGSGFCGQAKSDAKNLQSDLAALASISSTPARLKAEMQKILAAYKKAELQAPDQIKPDIAVVYAFMAKLDQAFAAHGYDPTLAGPSALPLLQSAKLKLAFAHLKAWGAANCGT